MKRKILSILLVVLAIFVAFSLNGVNAASSWSGNHTNLILNVDYATNNTIGEMAIDIPVTNSSNGTGVLAGCTANHYRIRAVNLGGGSIVTGWNQRTHTSGTTYSGNAQLRVNVGQTGTQVVTITVEDPGEGDWGTIESPTYNTVTVICSYSEAFRGAASQLGITFSDNNTVYNLNNINVYPTSYENFEAILNAKASYDSLNSCEKALLDAWIASRSSYSNFNAMYTAADNYLTSLANAFVTIDLQNQTTATRNNYTTIINANSAWTNLKPIVKNRVMSSSAGHPNVNYPDLLISAKAYQFIDTYNADNFNNTRLTKEVDKLILTSYPDAWTALDANVKTRVWDLIKDTNTVLGARTSSGVTDYPSWIAFVQDDLDLRNAEEFVNRNNLSNFDLSKFDVNNYIDIVNEGNEELAESIVGSITTDYNNLNDNAKSKTATDTDMGYSFETIKANAQNYLDAISAKNFINDNQLRTEFPANVDDLTKDNLEELKDIATNIIGLPDSFAALNEGAQSKVLGELGAVSFQIITDNAQGFLDDLESAQDFINDNNLDKELTTVIAEEILDLYEEELFDDLTNRAQDMVEIILDKTFDELVEEVDQFLDDLANKFISDNNLMAVVKSDIGEQMISERKTVMLLSSGLSQESQESEELNKEIAENALTLEDDFNGLSPRTQAKVLAKLGVNNAGGFDTVEDIAQEFLDVTEANEFIESNNLDEEFTKQTASNIIKLGDKFNSLSNDNVKEKVLTQLGVEDFEEVIEAAQDYLDTVAAQEFYDDYLDGLDEEKIVSGKDAWDNSSKAVQDKINKLLNDKDVEETYPELLEKAVDALNEKAAQDFINDYLTKDDEVIKEATYSNAKQIIKAEEAYDLLSDEVKAKVNSKLKEVSNTTYPELLKAAQDLQKNPKTGDLSRIMMILLAVSVLGIMVTRKKRK